MYNLNSIITIIISYGYLQIVTSVKKKKPAHTWLVFTSINENYKPLSSKIGAAALQAAATNDKIAKTIGPEAKR